MECLCDMPFYSKFRYFPTHHGILGQKSVGIVGGRKLKVTKMGSGL
jgi:hypothetical protein